MSDQLFLSVLTTLLNHPAFLEGLQEGIVTFEAGMFEEVLEKAWTEDDIIEFVDNEVSKAVYQQMQRAWRALGWSILPYLTYLGFTISYLALMLSTKANQGQQGGQDATC